MQQEMATNTSRYRFDRPKDPKLRFGFQSQMPHPKTQQIA